MLEIYAATNGFSPTITRYLPSAGLHESNTTEAPSNGTWRTAGTLSNLYIRILTNPLTGSTTFRTRKNVGNGAQSVSIGAAATGEFEDSSNTDTLAAGDETCYQIVTGTGGASITTGHAGCKFTPSGATNVIREMAFDAATISAATTTSYNPINGGNRGTETTEANVQAKIYSVCTLKNLLVYVNTNSRSDASTFRSRKNAGNGACSISVGAAGTGLFEDTVNSDSLVANDLVNYSGTTGAGTGSIQWTIFACDIESTKAASTNTLFWVGCSAASVTQADNLTNYVTIAGATARGATQSDRQMKARFAATLRNMRVYVSANAIAATTTVTYQKDGSDTTLTLSIGSTATGSFEDASNSFSFVTTSELGIKCVTGTSAGNLITFQLHQVEILLPGTSKTGFGINTKIRPAQFMPGIAR